MNDRMSRRTRGYVGVVLPTDRLTNVVRNVLAAQYGDWTHRIAPIGWQG